VKLPESGTLLVAPGANQNRDAQPETLPPAEATPPSHPNASGPGSGSSLPSQTWFESEFEILPRTMRARQPVPWLFLLSQQAPTESPKPITTPQSTVPARRSSDTENPHEPAHPHVSAAVENRRTRVPEQGRCRIGRSRNAA
jgi:hypothetical protein